MTDEEAIQIMRPLIYAFATYVLTQVATELPWLDIDDLAQEGKIGAVQAARSFDGNHVARFKTHAHYRVKGAIVDAVRRAKGSGRTRPQTWTSEKQYAVACWQREQSQKATEHGHEKFSQSPMMLPRRVNTGALLRTMEQDDPQREALEDALAELAKTRPREVAIWRKVFQDERPQYEVGAEYGVTFTRVSQIVRDVVTYLATTYGAPVPHIRWGQRPKRAKAYPAYKMPQHKKAKRDKEYTS